MNNLFRTLVSVFVAAIVVLIVIFTMHEYTIEPRGIFLPATDKVYPPFTGKPVAYYPQNAPFNYSTLGVINLRYHVDNQSEKTQDMIFNTISKQVAKAGGNGFIVDLNRTFLTPNPGAQQAYYATVKVISTSEADSISQ